MEKNIELRKNLVTALLLAVGFILRNFIPIGIGSMKGDIMLGITFVCILINPTVKNTILTGLLAGIITAMTTAFPGGQVANLVDKILTAFLVLGMVKVFGNYNHKIIPIGVIGLIGTIFSGSVFLLTALALVGLPVGFNVLLATVVLPTAVINTPITILLYKLVLKSINATNLGSLYRQKAA
jgi:thiamine transporter ThiT